MVYRQLVFPAALLFSGTLLGSVLGAPLLGGSARAEEPAAPPAASSPRSYTLDPGSSELYVQVYKDPNTLASGLSHDHVIVANGWTGTAEWDAADVGRCKVFLSVPVAKLVNDETAMRQKVGYSTVLSDGDRADIKEHMLGDGQLDAAKYPNITFTSTSCAANGDSSSSGRVNVTGTFTMHGTAKTITIPMKVSATDADFSAAGFFTVNQTDFGFQPFSALGGTLKNKNEVRFTIKAKGKAK